MDAAFSNLKSCNLCGSSIWPFEQNHVLSGRCASERARQWAESIGLVFLYLPTEEYIDEFNIYGHVCQILEDKHIDYRLTKVDDGIDSRYELWVTQTTYDVIKGIAKLKQEGQLQEFDIDRLLRCML